MQFLWKNQATNRVGVILDIGSGSVAAALVVSKKGEKTPEMLWSYREQVTQTKSTKEITKRLQGTILNVFLELGTNGLKVLRQKYPDTHPQLIQVAISAPFAHTIVKRVNFKSEKPVKITSATINEMIEKADKDAEMLVAEKYLNDKHQLTRVGGRVAALTINGYLQKEFKPVTAKTVTVCRSLGVITLPLYDHIKSAADKVLPGVEVDIDTFMTLYKYALVNLLPNLNSASLLDVTGEATELLLLREGVPSSTPYVPYGLFTLERELVEKLKISAVTAKSLLRDNDLDTGKFLNKKQQAIYEEIAAGYTKILVDMFAKAGSSLILPPSFYLHTTVGVEGFFRDRIKEAVLQSNSKVSKIHQVTSEFFDDIVTDDTALALSAYVFHYRLYDDEKSNMLK